jgi:hypothetical protein
MIEKLTKNNLFLSFSIVFLLFLLSLLIFKSTWAINDDVLMAMHVSGKGFSNEPAKYLVYTNIIIGSILKKFYQAIPSYPWYGLYTFFILITSFFVLLYSLISYKYSITRVIYFLFYFILFGLFFIRGPEFTTNAFLIGLSGAFLLLSNLLNEEKNLSYKIIAICVILLSLSSLIRIDSFFLVVILSLPLIVIGVAKRNFNKKILRKIFLLSVLLFLIVSASQIYDKAFYSKDDKWMYILEKAKLRGEMIDNNRMTNYSSKTKHIFDKVGWSVNDFILMGNWFSADDKVFSIDKMEKVLLGIKKMPVERTTVYLEYMSRDVYFYGSILLIIFFIVQIENKKKNLLELVIPILISLLIIIYLNYYVRLPNRVYMCIFSFLSFLALFFADKEIGWDLKKDLANKFKTVFIISFMLYFLFLHYKVSTFQKEGNFLIKYYINQLHPTKDRVFLVWAKSLPLELISVFDNLDDFSNFRMLTTNHRFNDPIGKEILKEFNVNNFSELIEKDNLFHIGNFMHMALFSQYLKEHYNIDVTFKLYMDNLFFKVYKHIKINPKINSELTHIPVNIKGIKYNVLLYGSMI